MANPALKRTVCLDDETFEQLRQYANQQGVSTDKAVSCFVRAGIQSIEVSERVSEMLEHDIQ